MATTITISGTSNSSNIILGSTNGKINLTSETATDLLVSLDPLDSSLVYPFHLENSLPQYVTPLKSKIYGIEILQHMWNLSGPSPSVTVDIEQPKPFKWCAGATYNTTDVSGTDISLAFTNSDGSVTNTIIPIEGIIEHVCPDLVSGTRTDRYNIFDTHKHGDYFYLFAELSGKGPDFYHPPQFMSGGKEDGKQFHVMVLIRMPLTLDNFEGVCAHYNEKILVNPASNALVKYFMDYYSVLFLGASYPESDPLILYGSPILLWRDFNGFASANSSFGLSVNPTVEDILELIFLIATTGVEKSIWNTGSTLTSILP